MKKIKIFICVLIILLSWNSSVYSKDGASGNGSFAYDEENALLTKAVEDIIGYLEQHNSILQEDDKAKMVESLTNLKIEPEGQARYRGGRRLDFDYIDKPKPRVIATEKFYKDVVLHTEVGDFDFPEVLFSVRRKLLLESLHIVNFNQEKAKKIVNKFENSRNRSLVYAAEFRPSSAPILMGQEVEYFQKASDFHLRVRVYPENQTVELYPKDRRGTSYYGFKDVIVWPCNRKYQVQVQFTLEADGTISGYVEGIRPKNAPNSCTQIDNNIEKMEFKGLLIK